jgi:hypothetical protein
MAHNLKPRPHFDTKAEKKLQAAIFTADENEGGGKKRPDFSYVPDQPLHWWYSFDGGTNWRAIPQGALVELDGNLRMVKVLVEQLEPQGHQGSVTIAVTEDADTRPTVEEVVVFQAAFLPPAVPFHLEGGDARGSEPPRSVDVSLNRSRVPNTRDEILWIVIRNCSNALSFSAYQDFMDGVFANPRFGQAAGHDRKRTLDAIDVPIDTFVFNSVDTDRVLKAATELFVTTRCGVLRTETLRPNTHEEEERFGHRLPALFEHMWHHYLEPLGGIDGRHARILPYLDLIRRKLGDIATVRPALAGTVDQQAALIQEKLMHPVLLELIWSYWMEEGMLVQSFNSITRRFQNLRTNGERDPLAQLELDPLRPASNLIWGWVQDETNRLSVLRRAHEYEHQYGFTLHGKAIAELRVAERRSKFLEAFHNLLWRCTQFYAQDDQTTVIADAFPVLNALKETHYLLAQGASNQFGNLPSQARQEMMMQQWILSRPEVREFLGSRVMVPYPEPWMDRVDSVKTLKGWTDTSVVHFRDLATFGEQVLLSVRWGAWSTINDPASAANWARYWRAEIQGYIHAYRVATSVDLTADITDSRSAETRFLPPSVHLRNRLLTQAQAR